MTMPRSSMPWKSDTLLPEKKSPPPLEPLIYKDLYIGETPRPYPLRESSFPDATWREPGELLLKPMPIAERRAQRTPYQMPSYTPVGSARSAPKRKETLRWRGTRPLGNTPRPGRSSSSMQTSDSDCILPLDESRPIICDQQPVYKDHADFGYTDLRDVEKPEPFWTPTPMPIRSRDQNGGMVTKKKKSYMWTTSEETTSSSEDSLNFGPMRTPSLGRKRRIKEDQTQEAHCHLTVHHITNLGR